LNTDKIFQGGIIQNLRRRWDKNHMISCGKDPRPLDPCPTNKGSVEERNRSHPLDISTKDQKLLNLKVSA
jgi:hypothetical protein